MKITIGTIHALWRNESHARDVKIPNSRCPVGSAVLERKWKQHKRWVLDKSHGTWYIIDMCP